MEEIAIFTLGRAKSAVSKQSIRQVYLKTFVWRHCMTPNIAKCSMLTCLMTCQCKQHSTVCWYLLCPCTSANLFEQASFTKSDSPNFFFFLKRSMTHKVSNRHPAKKIYICFFAQDSNSKCISAAIAHSWSKRPKTSKVGRRNDRSRLSSTKFPPMSYVWQRSGKDCAGRACLKTKDSSSLKSTRLAKKGREIHSLLTPDWTRGAVPLVADTNPDSQKHYGQSSYQ